MSKTGEIGTNNYGTKMKIIRHNGNGDIDIEFLDDYHFVKKHTTYSNFKNGQIKNPYDRSVYEIGMTGNGKYMAKESGQITKEYSVWKDLIKRCYSPRAEKVYPIYYGKCEVCNEWHNFQTFAKWYDENYYEVDERLHLDKDILYPGNKIYSPHHCMLVPQRINELFTYKRNNTGLPIGIKRTSTGRFECGYNGKSIGTFDTLDKAFSMYKSQKENAIRCVAEEYKGIIPLKLYETLINYKVIIENDINYNGSKKEDNDE